MGIWDFRRGSLLSTTHPVPRKMRRKEGEGVREVTVSKAELIEKLTVNRAAHRAIFEEAVKGFRTRSIEVLDEHIDRIRLGSMEGVYVTLPTPSDHTNDYDRALAMLEMSVDDQVTIAAQQFSELVMDDWSWKREFLTTNAAYSVSAARLSGGGVLL
jgi:hypothetical protein